MPGVAFNSLRSQNTTSGDLVAVRGLGGQGHRAIQYDHRMGYRPVVISSSSAKEKFAQEFGAHDDIERFKGDVGEQLKTMGRAATHGPDRLPTSSSSSC